MRKFFFIIKSIILSMILWPTISHAGWSDDLRLTYSGTEYLPQVISRNDTVHVVWSHDGRYIGYLRSPDGGVTWDSLRNLSAEGHSGRYPDISIGSNGLLVTWRDSHYLSMIAYSMSADGSEWTAPVYLPTDNVEHIFVPASAVKGDSIFIAYLAIRADSTGREPLRFFSSYDYGETWNDEITVGYPHSTQQDFLLTYCGSGLFIAKSGFVDSLHSGYHIVGYRSEDAGRTWSDMIWISPEQWYSAQSPCMACNEETGQIAVGYMDYRYQEYAFFGDVFIAISDDGGQTWPREVRATQYPTAFVPSIDFAEDTLVAVWSDRRYGNPDGIEIYYNRSDNAGDTWHGESRLTDNLYASYEPWVTFSDSIVHIIWRDRDEHNDSDIYYKRFTPNPTSIIQDDVPLAENVGLSAYPNPFNSTLKIYINAAASGKLHIYDLLGRKVESYNYNKGLSSITWETKDKSGNKLSTGVYFLRLEGGDGTSITKTVLYLK